MKYALTVLATLTVLLLIALVVPYTGLVNVSSVEGHSGLMEWYMGTTSTRSIQAHAGGIAVPPDLVDSTMIVSGALAFSQMCQTCHGGPGVERSVTGQGMAPEPPALSEAAPRWEPNEIYWILENGIKMAGMPAYGPTHSDEALWELVAFVKTLPEMTPERYAALTAPPAPDSSVATTTPPGHEGHDHTH